MYQDSQTQMDGLGKFKFKKPLRAPLKIVKKFGIPGLIAPERPHPGMKFMKTHPAMKFTAKKKSAFKAAPAPAVEPTYYQEPLPSPAPMPYYQPQYYQAQPAPQPQYRRAQPAPQPQPYLREPSARDIPEEYYAAPSSSIQDEQPFHAPESNDDYGTSNLPIVSASEFEASDDSEYGWLEGLSEGTSWGDIFTGAASELLANQRAKREAKQVAVQRAAMLQFQRPGVASVAGFDLNRLLIPAALGLGGLFIFMQMKKRRG